MVRNQNSVFRPNLVISYVEQTERTNNTNPLAQWRITYTDLEFTMTYV